MYRFETIHLGAYRGEEYFLVGFVDPEPVDGERYDPEIDADAYGVSLARSTESGSNVEIVRMDTAHGQGPHLDRLYLPPNSDEKRKRALGDEYTYERMKWALLADWRRFADLYDRRDE